MHSLPSPIDAQSLTKPGVVRSRPGGSAQGLDPGASDAQRLLQDLLHSSIVMAEDWQALTHEARDQIRAAADVQELLARLTDSRLLTDYQAARIGAGKSFGLILGNYRVLERLGAGGMGIVFKAEHIRMRRAVAVKVVPLARDQSPAGFQRFYAEMRAVAQLQHPNIVSATDAGEAIDANPDSPILHYYVMEYVPGKNLEDLVRESGPMPPARACDLIYQAASALAEAHKHELVHRDIKPSNVVVTADGQAKLLDFGLARHFRNRVTEPGVALGTIDYMAPEQARDASSVDIRADLYALGGVLYWCLTGRTPFPGEGNILQQLAARQNLPPPRLRAVRPEVVPELDGVIARLMAARPEDRYAQPQAVMKALLAFLKPESRDQIILPLIANATSVAGVAEAGYKDTTFALPRPRVHHVLIVDDEAPIRLLCRHVLQAEGIRCDEAQSGEEALSFVQTKRYDLVLLDVAMPGLNGLEVCRQLREHPSTPNLKIVMFSGHASADELARLLLAGADDYLTKPFSVLQLQARIKTALRLKDAQDRADLLNRHLLGVNHHLEQNLTARESDLLHARNALVLSLARLVGFRDTEGDAHLVRLASYCRRLAEEAAGLPALADQIDMNFIQTLEACAPLHDIGKVGLPDHILLKEGRLNADERIIMQTHTTIGAETLEEVARQHGPAVGFLQMAIDIVRHHHERYDGGGYPDRLQGSDIPLAARILSLGDVYDALRSRRPYKPALSHVAALQVMIEASPGHFDPALLQAFQRCHREFERVFRETGD
jgi:response regulator RpfG family c-di-GMP phosphodiesterase